MLPPPPPPSNHPRRARLLEAVWYRAGDDRVAAHHDPGWFSINVVNTGPGLTFRDERGVWTDAPPGVGVLWVGAAAAASWPRAVVPVVHRVAPTTTRPRLSVWCKTCAFDQLLPAEKPRDVVAAAVGYRMTVPNLEVPMDVEIENGEIERAVERVRRLTGLPSSKIITLTYDDALERKLRTSEKEEEKTFSSPPSPRRPDPVKRRGRSNFCGRSSTKSPWVRISTQTRRISRTQKSCCSCEPVHVVMFGAKPVNVSFCERTLIEQNLIRESNNGHHCASTTGVLFILILS